MQCSSLATLNFKHKSLHPKAKAAKYCMIIKQINSTELQREQKFVDTMHTVNIKNHTSKHTENDSDIYCGDYGDLMSWEGNHV